MQKSNSVYSLLKEAKSHIDSKSKWCKKYVGKDANGRLTPTLSDKTKQFCSIGALYFVEKNYTPNLYREAHLILNASVPKSFNMESIIRYNDDKSVSYEKVMKVWDKAINKAKQLKND